MHKSPLCIRTGGLKNMWLLDLQWFHAQDMTLSAPNSREKCPVMKLVHSVNVPLDWSCTERFERPSYKNRFLVLSTLEGIVIHLFLSELTRQQSAIHVGIMLCGNTQVSHVMLKQVFKILSVSYDPSLRWTTSWHSLLHSPSKETQHGKLRFFLGRV